MSENVYLIGMMGSGKTVTGKILADQLDYAFVDLDAEIQVKEGCSIPEIFAGPGEPYFRSTESSVLEHFSKKTRQVIATGGGIVLNEENVRRMKMTGKVVLLKASAESLWQRVRYSKDRPLLNKPDPFGALQQILSDRGLFYENACHFSVLTDGKIAEDVANEIQEMLRSRT
ncbi:MAG: shikimate kinase [Candidatus Omnitrophica bacterium]|nr:shikimate kinase [Candidatus Omnitrophota bacterium]